MSKENILEIEVDGPLNENLHFAPLMENLRGRMTLARCKNTNAVRLGDRWPASIPGQRLAVNLDTEEAEIIDGIHDDPDVLASLQHRFRVPPQRKVLGKVKVPTFLSHMKKAVQSGIAKVTKGVLPEKIEGEVQLNFYSHTHASNQTDKLAESIAEQTKAFTAMANAFSALAAKLSK